MNGIVAVNRQCVAVKHSADLHYADAVIFPKHGRDIDCSGHDIEFPFRLKGFSKDGDSGTGSKKNRIILFDKFRCSLCYSHFCIIVDQFLLALADILDRRRRWNRASIGPVKKPLGFEVVQIFPDGSLRNPESISQCRNLDNALIEY